MKRSPEESGHFDAMSSLRIVLSPETGSLRTLGRELMQFASASLGDVGGRKEVHDLRLAVQEAVANLLKHGTGRPAETGVVVEFRHHPGLIEVEIRSNGHRFDPTRAPAVLRPPENLEECGRGLFLISALVDRVEYEFDGGDNVLTLCKQLGAKEDAA